MEAVGEDVSGSFEDRVVVAAKLGSKVVVLESVAGHRPVVAGKQFYDESPPTVATDSNSNDDAHPNPTQTKPIQATNGSVCARGKQQCLELKRRALLFHRVCSHVVVGTVLHCSVHARAQRRIAYVCGSHDVTNLIVLSLSSSSSHPSPSHAVTNISPATAHDRDFGDVR